MISFNTLAAKEQGREQFFDDMDRHIFPAAILEIAHALSRGRKPSSCSLVTGDLEKWLNRMYIEVHPHCHDHMGDPCSVADDTLDMLYGWGYDSPESMRLAHAIVLCRTLVRPIRKEREVRGDWEYQSKNKVTNLKRKAEYMKRKLGTFYDAFIDYGDDILWMCERDPFRGYKV